MNPPLLTVPAVDQPLSLADPDWASLPRQEMTLVQSEVSAGDQLREAGHFRIGFDAQAIYLRVEFADRDVKTTATSPREWLFEAGDVAEWFIGTPPGPDAVYAEMHIAPNGLQTAYRLTKPRDAQPADSPLFESEVQVQGVLNSNASDDQGWSAQFTLPRSNLLNALGLDPALPLQECALTTMVARYNYGRHLPRFQAPDPMAEFSTWPIQPRRDFHLREHHAPMRFGS